MTLEDASSMAVEVSDKSAALSAPHNAASSGNAARPQIKKEKPDDLSKFDQCNSRSGVPDAKSAKMPPASTPFSKVR
jgi:hypothetical protein